MSRQSIDNLDWVSPAVFCQSPALLALLLSLLAVGWAHNASIGNTVQVSSGITTTLRVPKDAFRSGGCRCPLMQTSIRPGSECS